MADASLECLVPLEGAFTVRNIEMVRQRLIEALGGYRRVVIDCAGITEADLSFIQVILSARRSAAAAGIHLSLAQPVDDVLLDALRRAGVVGFGAGEPLEDQVFWLGGEAGDGKDHPHGG